MLAIGGAMINTANYNEDQVMNFQETLMKLQIRLGRYVY